MLVIVLWPSCERPLLDARSAVLPADLVSSEAPFDAREAALLDRFLALELWERLRDAVRLDPLDREALLLEPLDPLAERLDVFDEPRPRLLEPEDLARCLAAGI